MNEVTTDLAPHARCRSIQGWLREETAGAHAAAELAVMRALTPLGRASYSRYIARVHALYDALEPQLWRACAELVPDHALRLKVGWLRADLAALDVKRFEPAVALPAFDCSAYALGAAYVIEGATLGGPVLLGRLRAAAVLDAQGSQGARFLSGYGASNAAMWQAFRVMLQDAGRTADRAQLRDGALAMFRAYEAAIAEASVR
jgi:heme oxygenase